VSQVLESLEIIAASGPIDATVRLPGSKSYTNRALVVAALAIGESRIERALFSDDTRYMAKALRALGIPVEATEDEDALLVRGAASQIPATSAELFVGNAGTAARFLTAFVALGLGRYRIDGVARMRERPIGPLVDALRQLGVDARGERENDCPPVIVETTGLRGGSVSIDGGVSSQFISALMLVAPCTSEGITINVCGDLVSKPYVDLTASVMQAFGASVENDGYRVIRVPGKQSYVGRSYDVEPDASGASYFLAAAAVTGGRVRINGLGRHSAQGDLRFVDVLEQMGCRITWSDDAVELQGPPALRGIDVDMGGMSDVAQTLAAIAPFASSEVSIRGVGHIRSKETDRVAAVANELRRLGATVDEVSDGWRIAPSQLYPATIETYDDHRMAMSFAVTGLRIAGLRIANPGCVAKTFPDFFERFAEITAP
jgi:3-phosphoshikimate 1-carboxyvinyltransferase